MEELKLTITAAQNKFANAKAECSKLEKDMREFEGDKTGKMNQLKVGIVTFEPTSTDHNATRAMYKSTRKTLHRLLLC